jgi:hypothetical protein
LPRLLYDSYKRGAIVEYLVRFQVNGRVHYLKTEHCPTAVLAAQAIYECAGSDVSIWSGNDKLWQDGVPVEVS